MGMGTASIQVVVLDPGSHPSQRPSFPPLGSSPPRGRSVPSGQQSWWCTWPGRRPFLSRCRPPVHLPKLSSAPRPQRYCPPPGKQGPVQDGRGPQIGARGLHTGTPDRESSPTAGLTRASAAEMGAGADRGEDDPSHTPWLPWLCGTYWTLLVPPGCGGQLLLPGTPVSLAGCPLGLEHQPRDAKGVEGAGAGWDTGQATGGVRTQDRA